MTRRRKRLAIVFATLALLVVAYLTLPAIGSVSPEALNSSVANQAGSTTSYLPGCTQRRAERWSCSVMDSGQSGSLVYAVERDGRRCWTARLIGRYQGEGAPLPRMISGCVKLADQLWN